MSATITAYGIGLFVHVVAVLVAFGATFAYPFIFAFAGQAGLRESITAMKTVAAIDRYLVTPGSIVILLAGLYLVHKGDWGLGTSWVDVGIAAIVILQGMVHGFFRPKGRTALTLAERDLAAGGEPSAELNALTKQMAAMGQLASLIVLVTVFFMVVKP
ncbi:MAG: hypothetical protein QOJ01_2436 [Solirubrobacterales bacterium]|jgi:uncharacterized membrane protein|nr:hypothetical protein [Solirubrobacterales bacterium]